MLSARFPEASARCEAPSATQCALNARCLTEYQSEPSARLRPDLLPQGDAALRASHGLADCIDVTVDVHDSGDNEKCGLTASDLAGEGPQHLAM